jgi:hypothetical protein
VLQSNYWGEGSHRLSFCRLVIILEGEDGGARVDGCEPSAQRVVAHQNCAKDHRSYGRFKESNEREREKNHVNYVDEESASSGEAEVCVAEWVNTPKDKPISC